MGRSSITPRRIAAFSLVALAIGANVWIFTIVVQGFGGPSPANQVFGEPNVDVPISDTVPRPVSQIGHRIGFTSYFRPMRIDLLLARLNPGTQTGSFVARVTMPPRLLREVLGRGGHRAVTGHWGEYRLTPFGRGLSLPLRVSDGYGGIVFQTRVPLASLVQGVNENDRALTIPFDLPFRGRPGAFPDDWYELASDVVVWPPTPWTLVDPSGIGQPGIPVHLTVATGPAMRGYDVKMVSRHQVDGDFLRLVVETDDQTRALAYIIGSVPILLAVVALIVLVAGPRREQFALRGQELAFAVVLGVLAVLPIRQVTVPANLHGLTRIDLLLSLGVALSVGVLLIALSIQLTRRDA